MAGITTSLTTSARQEFLSGGHCFNATITATGSAASGSSSYTSVSSLAGVAVGMTVTGTNVGAGSVVAAITSATAFTASAVTSGTISGGTLTFTGDVFKMALITGTPTGTYGLTTTNYADVTVNSDETTGTGYTAGGVTLTNVSAVGSSGVGYITFGSNPSWTSATFNASGSILFNSSIRNGGPSGSNNTTGSGRALAVFSFGAVQTVSSGSFTILLPTASTTTAILRLA
jgi:hypothetical protein